MSRLFSSVYTIKPTINDTVDKISTIANGALCLPSLVTTALLQPQKILTGLLSNTLRTLQQQVGTLLNLIQFQVAFIINKITGKLIGILQQAAFFVNEIRSTINFIDEFKKSLTKRSGDILDSLNDRQNCEAFAANIINCLQNKVTNELTKTLQKEIVTNMNIDEIGKKVTAQLDKGDNIFEGVINKYNNQVNKANTQLTAVNRFATNFNFDNIGSFFK